MPNANIEEIKEKISVRHEGDEKQLEVIFSESPRLIVEAPAGYGKTTTMISRIAYLFAIGSIPNPKRILGLTFSVNAALKIKREVAEKLPELIGSKNSPVALGEKVTVTNYHGFCKCVLKKYGYLVSDALRKDVNLFKAVGDAEIEKTTDLKTALTTIELDYLKGVEQAIKETHTPDFQSIVKYNEVVVQKLLTLGYITHNAVILLVLELFERFVEVKRFYQNYYPLIVVDEFQDTNCIAWKLLETLIAEDTKLVFLGDPLQRIYGFIGALPNIMNEAATKYQMSPIALAKNYRFRNNPEMLKLDANIRENAATCFAPHISGTAQLPAFWGSTQQEEAASIVSKIQSIIGRGTDRVAVLFKARGQNENIVEEQLQNAGVSYFYGMFTDEDATYLAFHSKCLSLFQTKFARARNVNKKALIAFSDMVKADYAFNVDKSTDSLIRLLDALIEKVAIDYSDLSAEDKYELLLDIFENRQIKQAMEYIDSQVILSTIHGAKGLEWDYVIIADVEQWVMTFTCRLCPSQDKNNNSISYCRLPQNLPDGMKDSILDDLCVFYVSLTRARKQAYISASAERYNAQGRQFLNGKICCFALIDGISLLDGANNA